MDRIPVSPHISAELRRLARFPGDADTLMNQQIFCNAFATLAPESWVSLLGLMPHARAYCVAPLGGRLRMQVREKLFRLTDEWAGDAGIGSTWVADSAARTLLSIALSEPHGIPGPSTLVNVTQLKPLETPDGKHWTLIEPVEAKPVAGIEFQFSEMQLIWDPLNETSAQFRERAELEFKQRLQSAMNLSKSVMDASPIDLNPHWIEWVILQRVASRSTNSIAKQYGVTNPAVDRGVEEARRKLGLPDHRSTPPRYQGATSRQ